MIDVNSDPPAPRFELPAWSAELVALYESNAANQFILFGNVHDRMLLPLGSELELGTLQDFLLRVLMPRFDVILSYDLGNGIRVEKGGEIFAQWSGFKELPQLPTAPRPAIEVLTRFMRYMANFRRLNRAHSQVGCIVKAADLVAPALQGALSYDVSALALLIREWSTETLLTEHALATFLITENLSDLHPLLANNTRAAYIKVPLPQPHDLPEALEMMSTSYATALSAYVGRYDQLAHHLAGASGAAIESLLKQKEYRKQPLTDTDLVQLRKQLVERDCNGLIEFIESKRRLDDLYGHDKIKQWLRQDLALWKHHDLAAMPMGYLLCGPVGTGKTYLVECLAGEAGVPVVKLKNFRDRWVGSTEGNLEKIFRLLQALGRCYVFVDEADQALGRREAHSGDSGVSGRVYSMLAEEMSNTQNRGKVIWILASSRPDLIEVDLKRPGRIDVKMPLFPQANPAESFAL